MLVASLYVYFCMSNWNHPFLSKEHNFLMSYSLREVFSKSSSVFSPRPSFYRSFIEVIHLCWWEVMQADGMVLCNSLERSFCSLWKEGRKNKCIHTKTNRMVLRNRCIALPCFMHAYLTRNKMHTLSDRGYEGALISFVDFGYIQMNRL